MPSPSLGPLRKGEIPGIRPDGRPQLAMALVAASIVALVLRSADVLPLSDYVIVGKPTHEWWRLLSAPFGYDGLGYAFVALLAIAVFGWLLERRHGPLIVAVLFLLGGAGGMLVAAALEPLPIAIGGNGVALALLAAWAVPDLIDVRSGHEVEGDLLGAGVFAAVLLLLPIGVASADAIAGVAGLVIGVLVGVPLAQLSRAR
jgi:membrane associated rhomboid family serine protease